MDRHAADNLSRDLISKCQIPCEYQDRIAKYFTSKKISTDEDDNITSSVGNTTDATLWSQISRHYKAILFRLTLLALMSGFAQYTQQILESRDMTNPMIIDLPQEWTIPGNQYLWNHPSFTNGFIILCTLFIDFYVVLVGWLLVTGANEEHPSRYQDKK